jgi:monothiol glutaredoxin
VSLDEDIRRRIVSAIESHSVTLFMKGSREAPRCGFSATLVGLLDSLIPDYQTLDVLEDPVLRDGIKTFSGWPTIPQLYAGGEFLGGCAEVQELHRSGALHDKLGVEKVEQARPPSIEVSEAAAELLRRATADQAPGHGLQLRIDARFRSSLGVGPLAEDAIEVDAGGLRIGMDPLTASRAEGARIGLVDTAAGPTLRIDNPNVPEGVRAMSVRELEEHLEAGTHLELLDMRSTDERAIASLPGSTLLTPEVARRLESLPKDAMLVFHSHRGERGRMAAGHFAALGFTNVWNVEGGIDAWSQEIDPDVPRY